MKITNIVKFGVASLAMGVSVGGALPVGADQLEWKTAPKLNYFQVRGLVPPGSYSHHDSQVAATIAVNKSGQGIGAQNKSASKPVHKLTQHRSSATSNS